MKFEMSEAMKHRLVGLTVILAILAIVMPAVLKKNSQRLEERHIAVHMPPQPKQTVADRVDEEKVFRSIKVALMPLSSVTEEKNQKKAEYAYAEATARPEPLLRPRQNATGQTDKPLLTHTNTKQPAKPQPRESLVEIKPLNTVSFDRASVTQEASKTKADALQTTEKLETGTKITSIYNTANAQTNTKTQVAFEAPVPELKPETLAHRTPALASEHKAKAASEHKAKAKADHKTKAKKTPKPKTKARTAVSKKHHYAVQLGVFRKEANAASLLTDLQKKGFTGIKKATRSSGTIQYKVMVGDAASRVEANRLKQILLSKVKIRGFIVEKGVG